MRWGVALAAAHASIACYPNARWYEPVTPLGTQAPESGLEAKSIFRDGTHTVVGVAIRPSNPDVVFGRPRLTTPDAPPCTSGEVAGSWGTGLGDDPVPGEPPLHGFLRAQFTNATTDRDGLLLTRPTVLDVPVTTLRGASVPTGSCLRLLALASGGGGPEWRQAPKGWTGAELRIEVPVHLLSGIGGVAIPMMAVGAFLGPIRAGVEFGAGAGFGPPRDQTRSSGAGILEVGARVDSPLLAFGRFGTGVKVGYELESWGFGTDTTTNQSVGVGVHGPRAALRFLLLPPPPRSGKYDARPDAWSTGIELSGALLYVTDDGSHATALGGSYFGDIGW